MRATIGKAPMEPLRCRNSRRFTSPTPLSRRATRLHECLRGRRSRHVRRSRHRRGRGSKQLASSGKRTAYEAANDVAYEIRLHERHVRFYSRVRAVLAFVALAGGASAFAQVFGRSPLLLTIGGIVVATAAFIEHIGDFASKVHEHRACRTRWLKLEARLPTISVAEIDAERPLLMIDEPINLESLRRPARNDVCRTRGYPDYCEPLSWFEKLMSLIS